MDFVSFLSKHVLNKITKKQTIEVDTNYILDSKTWKPG